MAALSTFTDFVNSTPPVYISSPEELINDAIVQAPMFGRLLMGRDPSEVVRGGASIRDTVILNVTSTFQSYTPGQAVGGYSNVQNTDLISINWRFARDYMSWNESELDLNIPDGANSAGGHGVFKQLRRAKESRMWTSIFNGIEDQITATPLNQSAQMEAAGGSAPYSIFSIINEETDGLFTDWTTVQGINPATTANNQWEPRQIAYDAADPDDVDGDNDGLLDAMENMLLTLEYIPPRPEMGPNVEAFFQKSGRDPRKMFIATSIAGSRNYKRRLLEHNDTLNRREDPAFVNPRFAGIPVEHYTRLGTVAIYGSGQAQTESAATPSGPRYYFIDGNYVVPVIHRENFLSRVPAFRLQDQPDTFVQVVKVWWNLFCRSRVRQGVVSPGA